MNNMTTAGVPTLTCARMGLRLHLNNSLPERRFEELLAMLAKNRGIADELTFFTHSIHPAVPLEYLIPKLAILEKRMERAGRTDSVPDSISLARSGILTNRSTWRSRGNLLP